jgi:tripartite-type tricarboxylate transporter receptor subunit TctC
MMQTPRRLGMVMVATALLGAPPAGAQSAAEPFAGKNVTLIIGFGPGGGYDLYARLLARHMPRHLPGTPNMVVSNMPGAASVRAANYVYSVAPSDGTALGIVAQSIGEEQLLGTSGVSYDVTKFNWIGRFAANVEVSYVWHASPIKTIEDLKTTEASFAGTGPSSSTYPRLLNSIAGMKWKVVLGYNTSSVAHIAMERGEVDGATSSLNALKTTLADWLSKKMIRVIVQYAPTRSPELSDVPAVVEFGKEPEDIDVLKFYANSGLVGRSVVAPPGLPLERVNMLRKAFADTMDFIRLKAQGPVLGGTFYSAQIDMPVLYEEPEIISGESGSDGINLYKVKAHLADDTTNGIIPVIVNSLAALP